MSQTIFDFNETADLQNWVVVGDWVMGGVSEGSMSLDEEGNGLYEGRVSLENNGGFSLVRYNAPRTTIEGTKVYLRVKGDGKQYQFRMKANRTDRHSYVSRFSTNGEWQEIEIPLEELYATFRGRRLELPNFDSAYFEEIAFLIGNKKEEQFKFLIDRIELRN